MYMVRRSRTPQGVRGLKLKTAQSSTGKKASHSARSAWIETNMKPMNFGAYPSHSARSAWIETIRSNWRFAASGVALRKECVD